ncbi:MAG: prepilin-type N-terminal cleavage/methylation domain-containing protein [Erysipelotrichaceae bacterium]
MKSWSTMDKPQSGKGFTLIEMMLVLLLLSVLGSGVAKPVRSFLYQETQNGIIHAQTTALFLRESTRFRLDPRIECFNDVSFNAKGNVNTAQTLVFDNGREIVIGIGPGRIHE